MTSARLLTCICILTFAGCANAPSRNYVERVELLVLLQTLNADLLSHDSATLTLERWCDAHRLAEPAKILAQRTTSADKPIPDDLRARLQIADEEPLRYRHVQLTCGAHVLSEADNWYVPARLTPAMNRQLEQTDEPFGKVVRALGFQRRTLSADLLWQPLPALWEMQSADTPTLAPLAIPHAVLRHRAVLYTSAQQPFSAVVETYTDALFAFRSPRATAQP